jgi:tetratricopeptide (TPR) repeat protein
VSKQIAETLKLRLTPKEEKKIEEQPTQNAEAYELYLRGLEFQRRYSRDGYMEALELFEEAVKLDRNYADAYIAIANISGKYHREYSRDPKWLNRAEKSLADAEKITGETAKSLWIRGEIAWQKRNLEAAEKFLLRAIEIEPDYTQAFSMLGELYMQLNRYMEAAKMFEKASSLDTNNLIPRYNLLVSLSIIGDIERITETAIDSLPIIQKNVLRDSGNQVARMIYAYTLHWAGKMEWHFLTLEDYMTDLESLK